jgi:hypothetical protein
MAPADFGVCGSHHELFALPCIMVCLKNVLKTELNNPRIDACAINLPKRTIPYPGIGIAELRGIKGIVKFGPERDLTSCYVKHTNPGCFIFKEKA